MLYYLGKGNKFEKEKCKEYKTLKNALTAASKNDLDSPNMYSLISG